MNKPSIPKGTRDFGALEMRRRNYIFDTIRSVFALYGFEQIETPAMEQLTTLTGKYGVEGDRLLFKILNSGDYKAGIDAETFTEETPAALAARLCDRGLRYDLTVPFARYVVMHRNELTFPFKRYQMQPVWRADRPQKGRYREFYQCDADIIGTDSLLPEVDFVYIVDEVFRRLDLRTTLLLNNRKILAGIAEVIGASDRLAQLTICMDKLDKTSVDAVLADLESSGFAPDTLAPVREVLTLEGSNGDKVTTLRRLLASSEVGLKGLDELEYVLDHVDTSDLMTELTFAPSLARGLDYYTGAILEVKSLDAPMGSISGGGRYDNLTGIFGLDGVSGVGISFGAERIYDIMLSLGKFDTAMAPEERIMIVHFGEEELQQLLPVARQLRKAGFATEVYPTADKMKKQLSYANERACRHVIIAGSQELSEGKVSIKDMVQGTQQECPLNQIVDYLAPSRNNE